jgi:hypothetical protein
MESGFDLRLIRQVIAAGLALAAVAVQAASGVSIKRSQEAAVRVGMSATEVQQILGRPADVFRFRSAPGATWSYRLSEAYGAIDFDIDFDSAGRVISARERPILRG